MDYPPQAKRQRKKTFPVNAGSLLACSEKVSRPTAPTRRVRQKSDPPLPQRARNTYPETEHDSRVGAK